MEKLNQQNCSVVKNSSQEQNKIREELNEFLQECKAAIEEAVAAGEVTEPVDVEEVFDEEKILEVIDDLKRINCEKVYVVSDEGLLPFNDDYEIGYFLMWDIVGFISKYIPEDYEVHYTEDYLYFCPARYVWDQNGLLHDTQRERQNTFGHWYYIDDEENPFGFREPDFIEEYQY